MNYVPGRGTTDLKRRLATRSSMTSPAAMGQRRWIFTIGWIFVLPLVAAAGCGNGNGTVRLPVFGVVSTPQGDKLNGSIAFVPAENFHGPAALTSVVNGKYQFNQTNGPTAGPYQVIIHRFLPGSRIPGAGGSSSNPNVATISAADGKLEWKLTVNLTPGANQQDFALEP